MNSVAFTILNFNITWYSIFILIGVAVGSFLFLRESKKYDLNQEFCVNLIFWTVIFGIIGARIYYVLFNLDLYSNFTEMLQIWNGGLAIHGGIILGLLFIIIYTKKYKIRTLKITDMLVVSLIIAQAFGRWGNFFNMEAHGPATTYEALKSMIIIPEFVIKGMCIKEVYYIPTFYFESLWCILGFIVLLLIRKYKYLKIGTLTGTYLIWYGVGRFFIESLRTDSLMIMGFKMAQIVSVLFILIGIVLILINLKKERFEGLYDELEINDAKF